MDDGNLNMESRRSKINDKWREGVRERWREGVREGGRAGGREEKRREGLAFLQAPHLTRLSSTPSNTSLTILDTLG